MGEEVDFKALLEEKLAGLVQDVSELFDRMIEQHERQTRALKEKSTRQQHLLLSLMGRPRVLLHRSDAQIASHCRVEVCHKETESHHIKEEQKELPIKAEQEAFQDSTQPPVFLVKSEDEDDKSIALHPDSTQKTFSGEPHCLRSDEQTSPRSDGVKGAENSLHLEDGTKNTNVQSTSPTDLKHIPAYVQSDIEAQAQVSSDTEDSDEWSPEPQLGPVKKRLLLKSGLRKRLNNKRHLDRSTRKQSKSLSDEASEVIFECNQCHKTFLRKTSSSKNTLDRSTRCSACSATLKKGKSTLHAAVHKRKKRFVCKICKSSFTRPDNLSTHMLIHTGERPHSCTVCKKSFIERGHLEAHIRIHTGEKPFSCAVCKKSFTHRATRDRHERNHQGKRPFGCSECGARFKQQSHYLSHLVVHSGERAFSCPVCNKTYTRNSHVTSHMMRVHKRKSV